MEESSQSSEPSEGPILTSARGIAGPTLKEDTCQQLSTETKMLKVMESLLSHVLNSKSSATPDTTMSCKLVKFDPDEGDVDIEGWCKVTEIIVQNKRLEGAELLLALTHALKGRAAKWLTKLQASQLTWPLVKELLVAKFAKPMLPQDYFDDILHFVIGEKETAAEAAMRLWDLIERIPKVKMEEEMITGFVISVLCQRDPTIRRELTAQIIATRTQLCRALGRVILKSRYDFRDRSERGEPEVKRGSTEMGMFLGRCHRCGAIGHKALECTKKFSPVQKPQTPETWRSSLGSTSSTTTCFSCGQAGHIAPNCPERKNKPVEKEVRLNERHPAAGEFTTASD